MTNIRTLGDEINYNLATDKIIKTIDEPAFMTDRKRETLRVTSGGNYYLHTNNDRENELIITMTCEIEQWAEKNNVLFNQCYTNTTQFEGWRPYGAAEHFILDGREGMTCSFIEKNNEHAILKFDDIEVDFVPV